MKTWIESLRVYLFLTLLTGVFYPLVITLVGQGLFPYQTNGSLIYKNQKVIGSEWIAQSFQDPKFFWPRPSAVQYNPLPSGGSNLGPTSFDLKNKMEERVQQGHSNESLFASASGLDHRSV